MNRTSISALRKKYYEGDASLEEEKRLMEMLLADDAPSDWKKEGELMRQMSTPPSAVPPAGFEHRLIQRLQQEAGWHKAASLTSSSFRLQWWSITTILAASLTGITFFTLKPSDAQPTVYEDTCLSTAEAEAEVENTLFMLADLLVLSEMDDELGAPCE